MNSKFKSRLLIAALSTTALFSANQAFAMDCGLSGGGEITNNDGCTLVYGTKEGSAPQGEEMILTGSSTLEFTGERINNLSDPSLVGCR